MLSPLNFPSDTPNRRHFLHNKTPCSRQAFYGYEIACNDEENSWLMVKRCFLMQAFNYKNSTFVLLTFLQLIRVIVFGELTH
ncbi:MAG: hypothetical protein B0W54_10510 [Cellvibrio sp. 79]|nr:MAG: hypothetical protein B0W54_10510 [Cellvibrio sp. 79]